jgi:hypothetical protein
MQIEYRSQTKRSYCANGNACKYNSEEPPDSKSSANIAIRSANTRITIVEAKKIVSLDYFKETRAGS